MQRKLGEYISVVSDPPIDSAKTAEPLSLALRICRRLLWEAIHRYRRKPEWLKKKARVDREFDRLHGVDTGGYTHLHKLKIDSPNWRDGSSHIAVDPDEFEAAMTAVDAELSQLTFIDLGSGKGRALMLARQYPFKELIGVEFSEELVRIARSNGIETVHADATQYDLPPVPTLLFLYNPFGRSVMDAVAKRAAASLKENPRELIVAYLNPFHVDAWLQVGFKQVEGSAQFAVLAYGRSENLPV
jgi:hypothetical protein